MHRFALTTVAYCALCFGAAVATGVPKVLPGWPVPAGAGDVVPGPDGGIAVINGFGFVADTLPAAAVGAYRLDGRQRWVSGDFFPCGNCDGGGQVPGLQDDGTYGPLGSAADGIWAVSSAGKRIAGCNGLVLSDETCIAHSGIDTAIRATRHGVLLWTHTDPSLSWGYTSGFAGPPRLVHDRSGVVYSIAFASGVAHLVALDEATGNARWQVIGAKPIVGLNAGVIATKGTGLVRFDRDGHEVWARQVALKGEVRAVIADEAHQRVHLADTQSLIALDLAAGATAWRRAGHGLLSVGSNGTVFATREVPRIGTELRALGRDGATRWTWRTLSAPVGALRLPDGTVAVSTFGANGEAGLLWRLDPRQRSSTPTRATFTVRPTRFTGRCAKPGCQFNPRVGTVLTLRLPQPTRLTVRLVFADGSHQPNWDAKGVAPAGVSALRVFAGLSALPRGRAWVEVRRTTDGRLAGPRLPVTIL